MNQSHRNTIYSVEAAVLQQTAYPGGQYVVRFRAPDCARTATAGSFVHVQCTPGIPMRRPLSILRANAAEGWVEVLYKVVGQGLQALTATAAGVPNTSVPSTMPLSSGGWRVACTLRVASCSTDGVTRR